MTKERHQHLFVVDRLSQAINNWAIGHQFMPPDLDFLERVKEETRFNLEQIFGVPTMICSPYDKDFLDELKNDGKIIILIDSLSPFGAERNPTSGVEKLHTVVFSASKARIPNSESSFYPGYGRLTGKNKPIQEQLELIKAVVSKKDCIVFDDTTKSGATLRETFDIFENNGIQISISAVGISLLPTNDEEIKGIKIIAGRWFDPRDILACIDLIDLFDIEHSGANFFQGTLKNRELIVSLLRILKASKENDYSSLKTLGVRVRDQNRLRGLLNSLKNQNGLTNDNLVELLSLLQIPGVRVDLVSEGKIQYLSPGYQSRDWGIDADQWKELSQRQHELSIKIYEEVEKKSGKVVAVHDVSVLGEKEINSSEPIVDYIRKLINHE